MEIIVIGGLILVAWICFQGAEDLDDVMDWEIKNSKPRHGGIRGMKWSTRKRDED